MSDYEGSDYEEDQQDQDEIVLDNDAQVDDIRDVIGENEEENTGLRIQQKSGDRTCATYTFDGEDHTLGNLLRFALIKNPDVEFCGYSITHPSEHTVNLRLQTTGKGTNEVLKDGLNNVQFMAEVSSRKFREELDRKVKEMNAGSKKGKKK